MFFSRSREGDSFAAGQGRESAGDLLSARSYYEAVIRTGHPDYAPRAAHRLGHVLQKDGDTAGALAAYQRAIDSSNRKAAQLAEGAQTLLLGLVLQQLSVDPPMPMNAAGARAAYRWAAGCGRRDIAGRMAYRVGQFYQKHSDNQRAIEAYQQAIDSGNHEYARKAAAAQASMSPKPAEDSTDSETADEQTSGSDPHERSQEEAFYLGLQLEKEGDTAEALTVYQEVIDSSDPEYASEAAYRLGGILEKRGDRAGARDAYRQAANLGHNQFSAEAAYSLGGLLEKQRDVPGALEAYKQAEDADYGLAHDCVYLLLQDLKNLKEAQAAHQWAVKSGHHEAPVAAYMLGRFLEEKDTAAALTLYQQVIDSGHPHSTMAEIAQDSLLTRSDQKIAKALATYQWTLDFGDSEKIEMAADNLEFALLDHQNDVKEARKVHQWATDSGHLEHLPAVAHQLGRVFEGAADVETARALYQQAIDSGDTDEAPQAALSLGRLLEAQGDAAGARAAYQRALDSPDAQMANTAAEALESFLLDQQDAGAARAVYQWATDNGHGDAARRAAFALGQILEGQGDTAGALAAYQPAVRSGYRRATKAANALSKRPARRHTKDHADRAPADGPEVGASPEGLNNRERVGRGLEILASGLGEFTGAHLPPSNSDASDWVEVFEARDRNRGRPVRKYSLSDPRFQLRIITEGQRAIRDEMPSSARAYASELRETGNNWAHGDMFSDDDADRALDTMARLLAAVGATGQAEQVRSLRP